MSLTAELADLWTRFVLPWLVEATAVSALALAALVALRDRSTHLRCAVATLALVKTLLPPVILPASLLPWRLVFVPRAAADTDTLTLLAAPRWLVALGVVHLLGILLAALWCGLQLYGLHRLRTTATPLDGPAARALREISRQLDLARPPRAWAAEGIEVPFVVALIRPTLFVPTRWTREADLEVLRPVLAHELAHVRARDPAQAWLTTAARVVWWFHPLVRLLARAAEAAREERCDDLVLTEGLAAPGPYARALLDAAEKCLERSTGAGVAPPSFANASILRPGALTVRLRRITATDLPRRRSVTRLEVAALVIVAALVLPALTRPRPEIDANESVRWIHLGNSHAGGGDGAGSHHHGHPARHRSPGS